MVRRLGKVLEMKISYGDPYRQYLSIKKEIDSAMNDCIKRSAFIGGFYHEKFENQLAEYFQKPAALVASGTAAQQLSLLACGIGAGDEVIVPSMTFFSTAETVNQVGATPVFCDITLSDYCIDVNNIVPHINSKTKAIMSVDLYGQQCDYENLRKICDDYNLYLIQDSAQSFGSLHKNLHVGAYSDLAIHSFYPAKNLDCMGDGGAVTGKKSLIDYIRKIRNHGRKEKYVHELIGWNHRMDGLQAAILSVKIQYIDFWNSLRNEISKIYHERLQNTPLTLPSANSHNYHVFNQYCVLSKNRDSLKNFLLRHDIQTGIQFPLGCHEQPAYSSPVFLPNTEYVSKFCLSLPIYPLLKESEVNYICDCIDGYFK